MPSLFFDAHRSVPLQVVCPLRAPQKRAAHTPHRNRAMPKRTLHTSTRLLSSRHKTRCKLTANKHGP